MIVNIAGTSGSGKSHLVRSLLALDMSGHPHPVYQEGRRTPAWYLVNLADRAETVVVMGSYESPSGGMDTFKETKPALLRVHQLHSGGLAHVVYEGLYVMGATLGPELVRMQPVGTFVVLHLTTSLGECEASIMRRRAARAARTGRELTERERRPPVETAANMKRAERYCATMAQAGARVFRVSREEALAKMMEVLGT